MNKLYISNINFGHKHYLRKYYLEGKLPTVKVGLYGGRLTPENVTLEHITPKSRKGKLTLYNLALSTRENNHLRGNKPLEKTNLTLEKLNAYLAQFEHVRLRKLNGKEYIRRIRKITEKHLIGKEEPDLLIKSFLQNKLPNVKYDLYGTILTPQNVTFDYMVPIRRKNGSNRMGNIALVTKHNISMYKYIPMQDRLTKKDINKYLEQFRGISSDEFNGDEYINKFNENIKKNLPQIQSEYIPSMAKLINEILTVKD